MLSLGIMTHLRILYHLGVRCIGLTWNYANWAADGVMEPRKGGFTEKANMMLKEFESMGIIVDVSHLSVAAFWELAECIQKPFIASHSNAQEFVLIQEIYQMIKSKLSSNVKD